MDNRKQMVNAMAEMMATLPQSELDKVAAYIHGVKDTIRFAQQAQAERNSVHKNKYGANGAV